MIAVGVEPRGVGRGYRAGFGEVPIQSRGMAGRRRVGLIPAGVRDVGRPGLIVAEGWRRHGGIAFDNPTRRQ